MHQCVGRDSQAITTLYEAKDHARSNVFSLTLPEQKTWSVRNLYAYKELIHSQELMIQLLFLVNEAK